MNSLRFDAIKTVLGRETIKVKSLKKRSNHFGENVFDFNTMRQYVTTSVVVEVLDAIQNRKQINEGTARFNFIRNERMGNF